MSGLELTREELAALRVHLGAPTPSDWTLLGDFARLTPLIEAALTKIAQPYLARAVEERSLWPPLTPGRETDVRIARDVLGWTEISDQHQWNWQRQFAIYNQWYGLPPEYAVGAKVSVFQKDYQPVPHWSTDFDDAWHDLAVPLALLDHAALSHAADGWHLGRHCQATPELVICAATLAEGARRRLIAKGIIPPNAWHAPPAER